MQNLTKWLEPVGYHIHEQFHSKRPGEVVVGPLENFLMRRVLREVELCLHAIFDEVEGNESAKEELRIKAVVPTAEFVLDPPPTGWIQ